MRSPLAAIALLLLAGALRGQSVPSVDSLVTLRTPLSPAFALMGITPVAVERPSTPRAFAASLLSAAQGLSVPPDAWALEVAPYWLRPHPLLGYRDYYDAGVVASSLRTLALSVATSPPDAASDASDLGLGLRFQPVVGHESSGAEAARAGLRAIQRTMTHLSAERRRAERQERPSQADSLGGEIDRLADSARAWVDELQRHQEPVGWSVDVALAATWTFPTAAFGSGRNAAWAAWTTLGYRLENPQFQVLALGRFINNTRAADQSVLDVGGRWLWDTDRLVLSIEGVRRVALDARSGTASASTRFRSSGRLVGQVDYRLSGMTHLYASFGQDNERAGETRSPLLAVGGISFQFGGLPALLLPDG